MLSAIIRLRQSVLWRKGLLPQVSAPISPAKQIIDPMRYRPRTPLLHFFVRWRRDCFFCQIPQQGRAGNVSGEPPYCADHCGYTKKYDPHDIPSYLLDFFQGGKPSDTLSGFISGTSSTMPAGKVYRCRYRRFAIISLSVRFTLPKALYAIESHISP